ncbi:TetR/AcrR family transcriptional regulator [Roseibium sp. CAU 1637]|uniref:TetR/AcrR family transcriptional regulator n=1 Tax=Roseibium limicola TaxID=2816037 RepID=A0A939J4F1_9HYPH|nr:TetR/AcrR family transcriptional regulator [Roseibium limicola]MBO0344690.1 TetR/AcrR family transcriptional regulator [Roseibium limicola]
MKQDQKSEATRRKILQAGQSLVLAKGYSAVGLKQILDASGVPKGSFYYYFSSKEAFGCAMLEAYLHDYLTAFDRVTAQGSPARPASERMMAYFAAAIPEDLSVSMANRCLVVKLSAEISDLSEDMRAILVTGVDTLLARLKDLLNQGTADGSIKLELSPQETAPLLYGQWVGAAILAKLSRSPAPLRAVLADTRRRYMLPLTAVG